MFDQWRAGPLTKEITGDSFSIELFGAPTAATPGGGYISAATFRWTTVSLASRRSSPECGLEYTYLRTVGTPVRATSAAACASLRCHPTLCCAGDPRRWSGLDHYHRRFGRQVGVGVQHAKPIMTRPPQLDIGGELARLVGLGG